MKVVPDVRVESVNQAAINGAGRYVLYWMTSARRTRWNFGLERAVGWARQMGKPLVVLEALRAGYPWASDRMHRFVLDGMHDNARRVSRAGALYYPYVEPEPGAGKGLLAALARDACVVVTDAYPAFFIPRMLESAGKQLPVRLEKVDSNGLLPLAATRSVYPTAFAFRRFVHKTLPDHFEHTPLADPLTKLDLPTLAGLPQKVVKRWPPASEDRTAYGGDLSDLAIDHGVPTVETRGGPAAARDVLRRFLEGRLESYGERNDPSKDTTSELSPYLHFGHIGAHQVFAALTDWADWSPLDINPEQAGRRRGWWGAPEHVEGFLDQLVTWRELGFNMCANEPSYDEYGSLPEWARRTLAEHARDPRPSLYELEQFETAQTHDPLWNAAQGQLLIEGRIHNYLRMLWGKKILEWSASPEEALDIMVELNNRYAIDGRDPNSYSGIFWVLGRYDRPWGPERPVFGKIRYMTSENTARKYKVGSYIEKYAPDGVGVGETLDLFGGV